MNSFQATAMRILPIFLFIFSCAACGQELNNPNKLKLCPKNQTARFHNCWGTYIVDGDKYVGEFKDDKQNGQGTFTYASGDKYVGEFKDGKRHGQSTYTFASGDKYVGQWKDGKTNGQGTFTYASGDKYVGQYKDGKQNGQGTFTFADGKKYIGEYKDGNPNGQGTGIEANGDKYVGEFKDGSFHGKGIATYADGRPAKEGIWADHNVQVKGKNYLIPVKENIKKSFEVPASAIDVDLILATLESVKNDLNIVILDACRSPFPGESRGASRGLATMDAAKGTFVAFATSPGKEALDGDGGNSPYTKHLSRMLSRKGLPLEQVFKEVRKAVVAETKGEQIPWENSSLMGDFYFAQ